MTDATFSRDTSNMAQKVITLLIAGAFATLAFDIFGKVISPALGYATLAPVPLANSVIKTLFGAGWRPGAEALHYFAGMIAYPFGWIFIGEPLRQRLTPWLPSLAAAVAYGVFLWIFALYGMAHLIAGNAPFLGFTGITWVALVGHVLFALVVDAVMKLRG